MVPKWEAEKGGPGVEFGSKTFSKAGLHNDIIFRTAFINQEYGKNFSEFVNENRITYLVEFTKHNPESLIQYTLEVLGQMGGFSSRAAFIAAVKRMTGKPPSEIFGK